MNTLAAQGWSLTCAALLTLSYGACSALQTSPAPVPPDPVVTTPDPAPSPAPTSSPDPTALQLCLDNFQALNPDLPPAQVEELFCTGDQLEAWHRQALVKGKH